MWFEPGSGYTEPAPHADSSEIVVVVEGELQNEAGSYSGGNTVHGERGSTHSLLSETGCLLYVMFLER